MKKNTKSIIISIVLAAGAIFLISWVLVNNKKKNEAKTAVVEAQASNDIMVNVSTVGKMELDNNFSVNGNFYPIQQMNFASENSGRVIKVLVAEGSVVHKGQTLAIINADVISVDASAAQSSYDNALRDQQRFENAYSTGGVTQQQLDQAQLNLKNAKARLTQANIRVRDANIRSSINGIVNKRFIEPGAVVSPGTQLFEIVDVSKLKLKITVNESEVANLKIGDVIDVVAGVYPDKQFSGKITFIAPKADDNLNFPVELEIQNNKESLLKAGMYGTAKFNVAGTGSKIIIPRSAFVGSVNSNEVFVLENGNIAKIRTVIAGKVLGNQVEVLQGLKEGETVITSGQINLQDGSKVNPVKN